LKYILQSVKTLVTTVEGLGGGQIVMFNNFNEEELDITCCQPLFRRHLMFSWA